MVKRLIFHWSAGRYYPTVFEKNYYHYLIDAEGNIYEGKYKPEDNDDCTDGIYAAHTGGGNTGSIGLCYCGMYGFKSAKNCGNFPVTAIQFEAGLKLAAELCTKYKLPVNENTVLTHYEFGISHPKTTSAGKIDITYIPPYPHVGKKDAGSFIRSNVRWYKEKCKGG